jgi:hypothetical protein
VHHLRFNPIVKRRGGAVQVDIADILRLMPASSSAWVMARMAPSPCGCGAEIWCASLDSPAQQRHVCGLAVSTISAAPSPMVIPAVATKRLAERRERIQGC